LLAAYLWVVGTGLLGYLMLEQFIQRGDSWCVCLQFYGNCLLAPLLTHHR